MPDQYEDSRKRQSDTQKDMDTHYDRLMNKSFDSPMIKQREKDWIESDASKIAGEQKSRSPKNARKRTARK